MLSDVAQTPYMLHRKAQFRVTQLVREKLRVADQSIAHLRGNVIDGLKPGRTEIQVTWMVYMTMLPHIACIKDM